MEVDPLYFAFLLRLWGVKEAGRFVWPALLENPITGERKEFACLPQLFNYLESQTYIKEDHQQEKES